MEGVPPAVVVAQKAGGAAPTAMMGGGLPFEVANHDLFSRSNGILSTLPLAAISASDTYNDREDHGVGGIQLGNAQGTSAWCGKKGAANEITIDLLEAQLITGVALQGRASCAQWPTLVEIETSRDGTTWHREGNFVGVFDQTTVAKRPLQCPRFASFVKVKIMTFHGHPSMRMDVLVAK
eukprot:COSAG05_NODE_209_length_14039_cov_138.574892_7_plen_180_part_00